MLRQDRISVTLFLVVSLFGAVFGVHYWDNNADDGVWVTVGNWRTDKYDSSMRASTLPSAGVLTYLLGDELAVNEANCVIGSGDNVATGSLKVGQYCWGARLDIDGGTLNSSGDWWVGYQPYTEENPGSWVTVKNGGSVTINGKLIIGARNTSTLVSFGYGGIIVEDGTLTCTGTLYPGSYGSDPGHVVGELHLRGGDIYADGMVLHGGGHVYLGDGRLLLDGDVSAMVQGYVNSGWITGYDSSNPGDVLVEYNSSTGKTVCSGTTIASGEQAYNPFPVNYDVEASAYSSLSWLAGTYAAMHDVYFGSSYSAVNSATVGSAEYVGSVPVVTTSIAVDNYCPGCAPLSGTYYWRVDEVNDANIWKGQVWRFTVLPPQPVLESDRFRIELSANGKWKSIIDKSVNPERNVLYGTSTSFATIKVGVSYSSNSLNMVGDSLHVGFSNGTTLSYNVDTNEPNWVHFELESISGPRPTEVRVCQVLININEHVGYRINTAWDDTTSVTMMATTLGSECEPIRYNDYTLLKAIAVDSPGPELEGAAVAFVVAPTSEIRDVLQDVANHYEAIQDNQDANGVSSKDIYGRKSYFFITKAGMSDIGRIIEYCHRANLTQLLLVQRAWSTSTGHFPYRLDNFPDGAESIREFVRQLNEAGIGVGMHTFTTKVSKNDAYVTPIPDHRMWTDLPIVTVKNDITSTQTTIQINGDLSQWPGSPITTLSWEGGDASIIPNSEFTLNNEIIKYTSVESGGVYDTFYGCTRGAYGTNASAHSAGDEVHHWYTEGSGRYIIDQETTLIDETCGRMAEIFNECGLNMIYFDGGNDVPKTRIDYYTSNAMYKTVKEFIERPYYFSGCNRTHHLWNAYSLSSTVDTYLNTWRSKGYPITVKEHIDRSVDFVVKDHDSFMPGELGWFGVWPEDENVDGLQLDEVEYLMAKSVAYDAPISLETSFAQMDLHGLTPGILDIIGMYEAMRMNFEVDEATCNMLREKGVDYSYIRNGQIGEFVEMSRVNDVRGNSDIRCFIGEMANGDIVATIWHKRGESWTLDMPIACSNSFDVVDIFGDEVTLTVSGTYIEVPVAGDRLAIIFHDMSEEIAKRYLATGHKRFIETGSGAESPANGATQVSRDVTLSWQSGGSGVSYDVYLGSALDVLLDAGHWCDEFIGNFSSTSIGPEELEFDTTYYWAVDRVIGGDIEVGNVWSFTTQSIASSACSSVAGNGLNWQHSIIEGDNRVLVVGIVGEDDDSNDLLISDVSYNGVSMLRLESTSVAEGVEDILKSEMYYLLDDWLPFSGSYTVSVTYNGNVNKRCGGAMSVAGIKQQAAEATVVNSTANSSQGNLLTYITTETNNAIIIDTIGCGNAGSFTAFGEGMKERYEVSSDSSSCAGSTINAALPGTVVVSWQHSDGSSIAMVHSVAAFERYVVFDIYDLGVLAETWLSQDQEMESDIFGDGIVDFKDFAYLCEYMEQ
jgi:hypothetical protein